jgi:hypothetical protein
MVVVVVVMISMVIVMGMVLTDFHYDLRGRWRYRCT